MKRDLILFPCDRGLREGRDGESKQNGMIKAHQATWRVL